MEGVQIAIPDLEDEDLFGNLPQPAFASSGNGATSGAGSLSDFGRGSFEDLPGPSKPWMSHGRSGSGTSGESSGLDASGNESSSLRNQGGPGNWSFPRKGSFASLKAAIKGNTGSNLGAASATPALPTAPGDATPGSSFRTFARTTSNQSRAIPTVETAASKRAPNGHGRSESQLSGQSRSIYPSSSAQSRGHHAHQSSFFSEYSMGAASSTGSQINGMPPLPPFPEQFANPAAPSYPPVEAPGMQPQTQQQPYYIDEEGSFAPEHRSRYSGGIQRQHANEMPWSGGESVSAHTATSMPPPLSATTSFAPLGLLATSDQSPAPNRLGTLPNGIGAPDPRTPAEYALNVLMSRFLTRTQLKVQAVLDHGLEAEPMLEPLFGPPGNEELDNLLASLAHVSRGSPKPVIESLFSWQAMHLETPVDAETVRRAMAEAAHLNATPATGANNGVKDVAAILSRRKSLICAYILSTALVEIAKQIQPGSIGEQSLNSLLSNVFELLQSCSRNHTSKSTMQSTTFDKVSQLLGELSKKYFMPIGDRFISMLEHCAKLPPSKNVELAQETAVQGMRHLTITVFPMEMFEEGAEFLETVARFFAAAHGQRVKIAYAETLVHLILPVARSASAEINHPTWTKAMDIIAPRAYGMIAKPRYWAVAYPLYVATLCGSPEEQFSAGVANHWGWTACLEAAIPRLKDGKLRPYVLNTALRLIWVYMFRCRQSSNATTKRLETFFRLWFPPMRPTIVGSESSLTPHIHMVHLALYRHFDFGRDLVLEFLRHSTLSGSTLSLQPEVLSHQRMIVGIRAIVLTADAYVKGESPPFPSSPDFSRYESLDFENGGDELPEGFTFPKPEIGDTQATFNDLIGKIALICDHQVANTTVFDESTIILRGNSAHAIGVVDHERYLFREHPRTRLKCAYIREQQPFMDLLRACFESWPRCLSSSIQFSSVLSTLYRAHFSADPHLGEAASQTLRRIARQRKNGAGAVVSGFGRSIFRTEMGFWETHLHQMTLLLNVEAAVKVWIDFLNIWLNQLRTSQAGEQGIDSKMERTSAWAINDEVEAYGLLLLCSGYRPFRRQAISILRLVAVLDEAFSSPTAQSAPAEGGDGSEPTRIIHLLDLPCRDFCNVEDSQLTSDQRQRVQEWTSHNSSHPLSDLAESNHTIEHSLWQHVLPRFLRMCLEHFPTTVAVFRSHVTNRVLSMDAAVAMAAGLVPRSATTHGTTKSIPSAAGIAATPQTQGSPADQALMAEHWKFYILALCTTTTSTEGSRGAVNGGAAHRRQPSDAAGSERVIAARELFQKLVPFLASDQANFRDAVVTALGNINVNLYRTLLDTLQAVSSQLNDGGRSRAMGRATAPARRHARLRTALAHVVQLTSSHMSNDRTLSDAAIMTLILNWVKDTFNFLMDKDVRSDWDFQRVRRFFCGVIEDLYTGLAPRGECERYFPFDTRLRMFKLFSEWYSYSQSAKDGPAKLANLLANAADQHRDDKHREQVIMNLRNETQALSFHASDAMATLCQGPVTSAETPTQGTPFEANALIQWIEGLFKSPSPINHAVARRAFKSLLLSNGTNEMLVDAAVTASFNELDHATSSRSMFACFSDTVVNAPQNVKIRIPLYHTFCLGLTKLGHPEAELRRRAFALIDWAARQHRPELSLHDVEVGVSSPLPATYLRAQRDISAYLSHHFSSLKVAMVCEYTHRLERIDALRRSTTLGLLPDWLRDIDLLQGADAAGGGNELTYCSLLVLTNLLFLTIRHGNEHNFEIQDAWASLSEGAQILLNANAIIKFLIEQALCYRSPIFVIHAKRVVSCLSHTIIAPHMFDELCACIEPTSMIPVPREEVSVQPSTAEHQHLFKANLDTMLPPGSNRQVFSPGQMALLFIGELTYERSDRLSSKLALLLHAIFVQIDSFIPFVQEQCIATFEQLMRCLASMSAAIVGAEGASSAKAQVERLFSKGAANFWSHSDLEVTLDELKTPRTMRALLTETLAILRPLAPDLAENWGRVALYWATSGPVRHIACRSFQAFRIMLPSATPTMLADMLGRLSNTISDPNLDIQSFALEILHTFTALVKAANGDRQDIFDQIFWAAVACLNTINEREYAVAIDMLDGLLDKVDIGNAEVIKTLRSKCPEGWEGDVGGIQPLVLRGLRSSVTSAASFKVLARLAKIQDNTLIDSPEDRLAFLFVNALPWFLQVTDATQAKDETILELANDISRLAEAEGKADLSRVASSIAKSRFRTKDDLVRQAANSIRANFLPRLGPQLAVSLLGLTLNQHEWLRNQTMQVLKIFFQVVDTRANEFASLGSELLMPLLRLLSTPLAGQALEVLDEPIAIHGGPAATQILRMSLQWGKPSRRQEQASDASIFGAPDDSGWAVANPQELTSKTRINVQAVFKTCELTLDVAPVSIVDFVNEDYYDVPSANGYFYGVNGGDAGSLGDIVGQLQDLSFFFADEETSASVLSRMPHTANTFASDSTGGYFVPQTSRILARSGGVGPMERNGSDEPAYPSQVPAASYDGLSRDGHGTLVENGTGGNDALGHQTDAPFDSEDEEADLGGEVAASASSAQMHPSHRYHAQSMSRGADSTSHSPSEAFDMDLWQGAMHKADDSYSIQDGNGSGSMASGGGKPVPNGTSASSRAPRAGNRRSFFYRKSSSRGPPASRLPKEAEADSQSPGFGPNTSGSTGGGSGGSGGAASVADA